MKEEAYGESFEDESFKSEEEKEVYESFEHFGLNPQLTDILKRYSITKPLKIQKLGIPKIINGANTVIAAETGCGKTLTYLLPMIDEVLRWKKLTERRYNSPLGLIVTPTRELTFQIGVRIIKQKLILIGPLNHIFIFTARSKENMPVSWYSYKNYYWWKNEEDNVKSACRRS